MKINELFEAYFDDGIHDHLEDKGYKFIGSGVDQTTWLEPGTGLILKVFGADTNIKRSFSENLSRPQKLFKVFADYCMKHAGNKFLPNFLGWQQFKFKGQTYVQIRMERLFSIDDGEICDALAEIGAEAPTSTDIKSFLDYSLKDSNPGLEKLIIHIGKDGLKELWMTIHALSEEAKKHGFSDASGDAMDLHQDNFMYGSDGHIVISDPYHVE